MGSRLKDTPIWSAASSLWTSDQNSATPRALLCACSSAHSMPRHISPFHWVGQEERSRNRKKQWVPPSNACLLFRWIPVSDCFLIIVVAVLLLGVWVSLVLPPLPLLPLPMCVLCLDLCGECVQPTHVPSLPPTHPPILFDIDMLDRKKNPKGHTHVCSLSSPLSRSSPSNPVPQIILLSLSPSSLVPQWTDQ